jgi:hypothetical protein
VSDDETDPDEARPYGLDENVRETIVAVLAELDGKLERPSEPLDLGEGLRWVPDLVDAHRVVHVELGERIPTAFTRRLRAARAGYRNVVVATKAEALAFETLKLLQELEVAPFELHVDEEGTWHVSGWSSVADWVSGANMALRPAELRELVGQCLVVADDPNRTNHARGHAYEEALCLMFSQVSWLKVHEHAYSNATEEIDIVMLVTGAGAYARLAGGPLAIATAKNEKKSLGSATIKYLEGQMGNRRGRCKLGFACARGEVSKGAHLEIIGLRRADVVIVPMGGEQLQQLLEDADRLDERLAEMVVAVITT